MTLHPDYYRIRDAYTAAEELRFLMSAERGWLHHSNEKFGVVSINPHAAAAAGFYDGRYHLLKEQSDVALAPSFALHRAAKWDGRT